MFQGMFSLALIYEVSIFNHSLIVTSVSTFKPLPAYEALCTFSFYSNGGYVFSVQSLHNLVLLLVFLWCVISVRVQCNH